MKIASWNVNSVKARLGNIVAWLATAKPDVVLMQEIKCMTDAFPAIEFEDLGYNLAVVGQKSYNGVAILSRYPLEDVRRRLPGDESDEQARYVEAWVAAGKAGLRVASIYLPNGNPVESEKYPYKLAWLARLKAHGEALLAAEEPLVLGGDYNVAPDDADVYDPAGWAKDALCRPESRAGYRALVHLGFTDAFRAFHDQAGLYSFWDYQGRAFEANHGLRIDHLLLSPQAADRLERCDIDIVARGEPKASDHAPIWCAIADPT